MQFMDDWGIERAKLGGPVYERGKPCHICASRRGTGRWKLQLPTKEERTALEEKRAMENQVDPHRDTVPGVEKASSGRKKRRGRGKA